MVDGVAGLDGAVVRIARIVVVVVVEALIGTAVVVGSWGT